MNGKYFRAWRSLLLPTPLTIDWRERLRACIGALLGIGVTAAITALFFRDGGSHLPWLIAPMGASAVLLFAVPASPLAQPWPVLAGNTLAAAIGITCAQHLADPMLAATLAVASTVAAMFALRCVHPPAGAVALTVVLGGPHIEAAGYAFLWHPLGINTLLLLGTAVIYHRLTGHSYPHRARVSAALPAEQRPGRFSSADLDQALRNYNEILDINRDDLEMLLRQAELHAYRRRFGEVSCADIMSREVIAATADTTLARAWSMLNRHRIKALPVIDAERRVIGIVTRADFLKHTGLGSRERLRRRLHLFLGQERRTLAQRRERLERIMAAPVQTASQDTPIAALVPLFADLGHHHIPIVDGANRLVGMVTQSDLIVALSSARLDSADSGTRAA